MTERKVSFNNLTEHIHSAANLNLDNIQLKRDFLKKLLSVDFQDKDILMSYWEPYSVVYISILSNIEIEQNITEPKLKHIIQLLKTEYFTQSKRNIPTVVARIASLDMTDEVIAFMQFFLQL